MTIPAGQLNGIYYYDFNHSGEVGVHTYTIDCARLGLRYFLMGTYHVFDNVGVAQMIWNYGVRNLTYYPATTNVSNLDQMVSQIWSSNANRTLSDSGVLWVGGAEYDINETQGKIVVRMVNSNGVPVTGGICVGTIMNPDMSIYANLSVAEITIRAGMYYANFSVPKVTGVYPYGIDCTQGGKNYYLADTFHVRNMANEVWNNPQSRNLTYYEDKTNYTKIPENVWANAIWEFMGARAEILN
jgi:hypothetical protein